LLTNKSPKTLIFLDKDSHTWLDLAEVTSSWQNTADSKSQSVHALAQQAEPFMFELRSLLASDYQWEVEAVLFWSFLGLCIGFYRRRCVYRSE
jgi:hypothetical protein